MSTHERHAHRLYGMTCEEYDALHERQGGRCGVCGNDGPLVIDHDHDHDTRAVRGLVCSPCNSSLGPVDAGRRAPSEAVRQYLARPWHTEHRPDLPSLYRIPGRVNHDANPMGVGEVAQLLGVSRQRVQQLMIQPGFPEPWVTLQLGAVWRDSDIEAWAKTRNTKRGRPRKTS